MALKDLQLKLQKRPFRQDTVTKHRLEITDVNADVACCVIDHLFRFIDSCLQTDKSKVRLSLFSKSFIKGLLSDSIKDGINDFVRQMQTEEINMLLDDIQGELDKRKRI